MFTYQNESKYCESNPNHGYSNHFYINNNCKYCRCKKTYTINMISYILGRLADYFNREG